MARCSRKKGEEGKKDETEDGKVEGGGGDAEKG